MPDYSVITQSPKIRAIVQDGALERAFHDALFPNLLYRLEAGSEEWPGGIGDNQVFTGDGLMPVNTQPRVPGVDPTPTSRQVEQWTAQIQQYHDTTDTFMPDSVVAIADLFLRNAHALGMQSAQTLNRVVRNKLFAAAESGNGVIDQAAVSPAVLVHVSRLNGFTKARNPTLSTGSTVKFDYVSSSNPLSVTLLDNGTTASNTVIAFSPDVAGDEFGPGWLTLGSAVTNVASRSWILSVDCTKVVRSGGGNQVDAIGPSDLPTWADARKAVSQMRKNNVPTHPDMRYHAHLDPDSESFFYADPEQQRLFTALPDMYVYKDFAIGEHLGVAYLRNTESPLPYTVNSGVLGTYDVTDNFPGELYANGTTGTVVHRILYSGQGGIIEYWQNPAALLTEAGVMGKLGEPEITNNGIRIFTDHIQLILRAPQDRLQQMVSSTWQIKADWALRTDSATGDAQRYKRHVSLQHGE